VRVQQETDEVYHIQDFHVQEGNPESPRHLEDSQQGGRRIPVGHRSQSEADWAYARRALARGDAPDEVIRRIADYRAEDKADPGYYAPDGDESPTHACVSGARYHPSSGLFSPE
jgi:hypothetical protein